MHVWMLPEDGRTEQTSQLHTSDTAWTGTHEESIDRRTRNKCVWILDTSLFLTLKLLPEMRCDGLTVSYPWAIQMDAASRERTSRPLAERQARVCRPRYNLQFRLNKSLKAVEQRPCDPVLLRALRDRPRVPCQRHIGGWFCDKNHRRADHNRNWIPETGAL
jgi:hypothetical protein